MLFKNKPKRVLAGILALAISVPTILSHVYINSMAVEKCTQEHEWTGLNFTWTNIPTTTGEIFGWPRKTYVIGGTGDYANMNGMYVYCVANHTEQPRMGSEPYIPSKEKGDRLQGKLMITDYMEFAGNQRAKYDPTIRPQMLKFTFCLAAAATIAPGKQSTSDLKSQISTTYLDVMAQSVLLAIEGRMGAGIQIETMDREAARTAYHNAMQAEYYLDPATNSEGKTVQMDLTIRSQILANRDKFFDDVWDAAIVMYNAIQDSEAGVTANRMNAVVDPSDPSRYIVEVDCYGLKSVWDNYYAHIQITEAPGWSVVESGFDEATGKGRLVFQGPAGVDINQNGIKFKFANSGYLTDLNEPVLYQFDFCTTDSKGELRHGGFQTMFCAMQKEPSISVGGGGGGGVGGNGPLTEGSIELEIHRYKHDESWQTTYNVDLIKLDSETGKPLSDSHWDVLEYDTLGSWDDSSTQLGETYLDHPVEQASSIGTKYNWANDNGTQFIRWDEEDACDRDHNITGQDGYLYEANTIGNISSSKAHADTYSYEYTKGFCTGHPKPVITYYECDHEDDCDCDEKNAELDRIAEEAWNEQVAYCEKLAAEGGFFHTAEESITDTAKKEMEADRDQFYKDFISLTYDYSAEEIQARTGYILHDTHTDDIPVERVVIHSSEYLDEIARGNWGSEAGGSGSDDDDAEEESLNLLYSAVKSVQDAEMDSETSGDVTATTSTATKSIHTTNLVRSSMTTETDDNNDDSSDDDNADDDLEIPDLEITGDGIVIATGSDATSSNAVRDEVEQEKKTPINLLKQALISLFRAGDDDDDDGGSGGSYARNDSEPPKTEGVTYIGTINFEISDAPLHVQGERGIECWTFIIYDHRTEGEIHFNKRDLDLVNGEEYDETYSGENGDGTLEGAVYGLFAMKDIVHPDSDTSEENEKDTGIVYKAGDLAAVAATDRNGDGSFMTFTEMPGMTYNYETGKIEKRTDIDWDGPRNLHDDQGSADASVEDNELFYGWDDEGAAEVTLTDSEAGDGTYYWKHSSNQGLNCGEGQDDGTTYPILNDNENNGNYWIGRPLIVSGENAANYYIKELSRSEGYELSVYGKDMLVTNRDAFENGGDMTVSGDVSVGQMSIQQSYEDGEVFSYNDITVTAEDTMNGFDLTFKNLINGGADIARFYVTAGQLVEKEEEVKILVPESVPVEAAAGQPVLINGSRVEAELGDTVTLPNGETATVNAVITDSGEKVYATKNVIAFTLPNAEKFNAASESSFKDKYNDALYSIGMGTPAVNAPWILVPVGANSQESFNNMTAALQDYTGFNQMRIIEETNGYYVVQYSRNGEPDALYDITNQIVWIKKEVTLDGAAGYLYARYDAAALASNTYGFVINDQVLSKTAITRYEDLSAVIFHDSQGGTYWTYADGEQMRNSDGSLATNTVMVEKVEKQTVKVYEETEQELTDSVIYNAADGFYKLHFDSDGTYKIRIRYDEEETDGVINASYAKRNALISYYIAPSVAGSYIKDTPLEYPGETEVLSDFGSIQAPVQVEERPICQKVKINKDIQTLAEPKVVWYCLNCGYENQDGEAECGYCGHSRSTEETRTIYYAHDTYSAVHSDNISAERDAGWYTTVTDWLTNLLNGNNAEESSTNIPNFRFKAYLKSNLERLYRDEEGNVTWMDRNGNTMTPQYLDTNGDGNYDTFTWKYDTAYNSKTVDFPEKDILSDDGTLESTNVQKIYTQIDHVEDSKTTSAQANNVWSDYDSPQTGATYNVGEKEDYTTSEREKSDGTAGDLDGMAVRTNSALYSYDGKNDDVAVSDKINVDQNTGYTRLLEMTKAEVEDGAGKTRTIETYNYEKFFDAIYAANTDIWDDDMHSTYTGTGMSNYPGQHWFETFYEKYQKDDADPDHTLENTDGTDSDNTAGGDRDTSFKPFRWIREHVFGDRSDYEKYPAEHNGVNTEVGTSTSDFARANAETSDAVRQFAEKWYLKQEAGKLMVNNGVDEDIAKTDGTIDYDEAVYDEALFNAIAKAYNYLKPFYMNDLDTIYSVEWDSAANGGSDKDYTTLSIDLNGGDEHYNISSYLPYGVYVVVEQQPERRDKNVNDWENRSYSTEKPKEVIVPSVYDAAQPNDTTDNYDTHYNYTYDITTQEQAKAENYLIRFGEEWAHNNTQDEREYVIRAHSYYGDFEVYKYGLDIDKLHAGEKSYGGIIYPAGSYDYAGWKYTQEQFDPLKDYYDTAHAGEDTVDTIGTENGGNDNSDYMGIDKTNGAATANGSTYDGKALQDRFFYAGISEDAGKADNVMYKGGSTDDNNVSGMQWKDNVRSMTGELTAYEGKYAAMLVPWTVTASADHTVNSSEDFSGYADVNERNSFYTAMLKINKVDSETGEYILHDNAIFGLYAGSRYQTFDEIEADAKLIEAPEEREMFLKQFKPGDAKFYLQDTVIEGTREFLMAMGATEITPFSKGRSIVESGAGVGELCTGLVKKGTPVCVESEKIMLTDEIGARTGQMTVYTTLNDVLVAGEVNAADKTYANQNTGYFITPQPIGAGVYVLAELKAPEGYARSKPITFEVYSDKTAYYVDGDMYNKVNAVRQEGNLLEDIQYNN